MFARFVPPGSPETRFVLSANEFYFEAKRPYQILVIAAGTGYNGGYTSLILNRDAALDTLYLPAGLQEIGEKAFAGVAAERIVVPEGVTVIEPFAFSDCPNLIELVLPDGITFFAPDALGTTGPVYVYGLPGGEQEGYAGFVQGLVFVEE